MTEPTATFEVVAPTGSSSGVLAHIPHASVQIPDQERSLILLDDADLQAELVRMTDWHTDALFAWTEKLGATRFINRTSRLIVDPERFANDEDEPMARVGQGAVYVRSSDGRPLRQLPPGERDRLLRDYFEPYHASVTDLVTGLVETHGRCLVLDCHSFASYPLAHEPDQRPGRPDVCLGTDRFHTPTVLLDAMADALRDEGFVVAVDRPFSGAFVPFRHHLADRRVAALMLEVRRGLYCDEMSGAPTPGLEGVSAKLERATARALEAMGA